MICLHFANFILKNKRNSWTGIFVNFFKLFFYFWKTVYFVDVFSSCIYSLIWLLKIYKTGSISVTKSVRLISEVKNCHYLMTYSGKIHNLSCFGHDILVSQLSNIYQMYCYRIDSWDKYDDPNWVKAVWTP